MTKLTFDGAVTSETERSKKGGRRKRRDLLLCSEERGRIKNDPDETALFSAALGGNYADFLSK